MAKPVSFAVSDTPRRMECKFNLTNPLQCAIIMVLSHRECHMKNNTVLIRIHLALLIILVISSIGSTFLLMSRPAARVIESNPSINNSMIFSYIAINCVSTISLICSVVYFINRHNKPFADVFFKVIILCRIANNLVGIAANSSESGSLLGAGMGVIQVVLMILLALSPETVTRKTWTLFYILLAIDLVIGFTYITPASVPAPRVIVMVLMKLNSSLSRLLVTGSIGLALKNRE